MSYESAVAEFKALSLKLQNPTPEFLADHRKRTSAALANAIEVTRILNEGRRVDPKSLSQRITI